MRERIKELCEKSNTNFSQVEKKLGFANGSIAKSKLEKIQAIRVYALAQYFHVSMEYLMTGTEKSQNRDISDTEWKMVQMYRAISSDAQETIWRTIKNAYEITIEKKEGSDSGALIDAG